MKQIITLIVIACLFYSCNSSRNQNELKRYTIAYNVHLPDTAKDDWETIHMNFDGSGKKNIINNDDVAWTYHAYKDRLFFISDRDTSYRHFFLYECDGNGDNVRKVSNLRLEDSWMSTRKDGEEMIVSGRIDKSIRFQFFIINTSTGEHNL